jgi:hypothetical protein
MKNITKLIQPLSKKIQEQLKIVAEDKYRIYQELSKNEKTIPSNLIKPISISKVSNCEDIASFLQY